MKRLLIAGVLVSSLFVASCGNNDSAKTETEDPKEIAKDQNEDKFDSTDIKGDADFAVKIADAGMLEVELGRLALKNASSPKVKEFAQMMIDDHSKNNAELMEAAKKKNITLPAGLSDKCQKKYSELSEKKGKDFDKDYMSAMVDGHQEVLDELNKQAEKGNDADLKAWAQSKVEGIKLHLETAKTTKDMIK
jgi:putative membrane protein